MNQSNRVNGYGLQGDATVDSATIDKTVKLKIQVIVHSVSLYSRI
jgi:hypothetical protein